MIVGRRPREGKARSLSVQQARKLEDEFCASRRDYKNYRASEYRHRWRTSHERKYPSSGYCEEYFSLDRIIR